jgi:hypothetical protein
VTAIAPQPRAARPLEASHNAIPITTPASSFSHAALQKLPSRPAHRPQCPQLFFAAHRLALPQQLTNPHPFVQGLQPRHSPTGFVLPPVLSVLSALLRDAALHNSSMTPPPESREGAAAAPVAARRRSSDTARRRQQQQEREVQEEVSAAAWRARARLAARAAAAAEHVATHNPCWCAGCCCIIPEAAADQPAQLPLPPAPALQRARPGHRSLVSRRL